MAHQQGTSYSALDMDSEEEVNFDLECGEQPFHKGLTREEVSTLARNGLPWTLPKFAGAIIRASANYSGKDTSASSCAMRWNSFRSLLSTAITEEAQVANAKESYSRLKFRYVESGVHISFSIKTKVPKMHKAGVVLKAIAWDTVCRGTFKISLASGQIDPVLEGPAGTPSGGDDKKGEVIITHDEESVDAGSETVPMDDVMQVVSTEPLNSFDVVNRYMALPNITVSVSQAYGNIIWKKSVPYELYHENASAINLMPFKNHIYMNGTIRMKFVPNGHQFGCGRVVVSVIKDPYLLNAAQWDGVKSAVTRDHVIIDLSSNNEVNISIPYCYRRPLSRVQYTGRKAYPVRPAFWAIVEMRILSAYSVATGQPTTMYITPWYCFEDFSFGGETWSPAASAPIGQVGTATGLYSLIKGAESLATRFGLLPNCDKPIDYRTSRFLPTPLSGFGYGKGVLIAQPLSFGLDSTDTILPSFMKEGNPTSLMEIARIWGLVTSFSWKNDDAVGKVLHNYVPNMAGMESQPFTPLEYVVSMYQGWSGPIELRYDFVCTDFHQGAVSVAISFGSDSGNYLEEYSTYVKQFHLSRNQKSFSVTVPYIYDTVFRRKPFIMYALPYDLDTGSTGEPRDLMGLRMQMVTTVKTTVVNPLVPIANAAPSIQVQMFMRAGEGFALHRPVGGVFCTSGYSKENIVNFPKGFLVPVKETYNEKVMKAKELASGLSTGTHRGHPRHHTFGRKSAPITWLTDGKLPVKATQVLDYYRLLNVDEKKKFITMFPTYKDQLLKDDKVVEGQINVDEENIDSTRNFSGGSSMASRVVSSENTYDIKDQLRTPVLIHWRMKIPAWTSTPQQKYGPFWIPIIPPSGGELVSYQNPSELGEDRYSMVQGIMNSRHAQILSMFGQYRGNAVYHFMFYGMKDRDMPIYVQHVPHDGSFKYGAISQYTVGAGSMDAPSYHLGSTGLMTQVVIPSVNPTVSISVPFTHENTWCVMHTRDWHRQYCYRDKGSYNNGHIVLTSSQDVNFDVWWEAGDQFMVSNYNGIPNAWDYDVQYLPSDAGPSPEYDPTIKADGQIDSDTEDFIDATDVPSDDGILVGIGRNLKSECYKLGKMVLENPLKAAVSVAAPSVSVAMAVGTLTQRAESVVEHMEDTCARTSRMVDQMNEQANLLGAKASIVMDETVRATNGIQTSMVQATGSVTGVMDVISKMLTDTFGSSICWVEYIHDLAIVVMANDIKTTLYTIFRVFQRVGLLSDLEQVFSRAWSFIATGLGPVQQIEGQTLGLTDTEAGSLTGLLVGIVASYIGYASTEKMSTMSEALKHMFTIKSMGVVNICVNLCKSCFAAIRKTLEWCVTDMQPLTEVAKYFEGNEQAVKDFYINANYLLNTLNDRYSNTAEYKKKVAVVWVTTVRLHELACQPNSGIPVAMVRYLEKIKEWFADKSKLLAHCPVKFTPIGIYVHGQPGVGKSECVQYLMDEWFRTKQIGVADSSNVFIRNIGSEYVNGYRGQPGWMYDDFAQFTGDVGDVCFTELIQLCSPALFIPNRADLRDKEEPVSPMIVGAASNVAWPRSNVITEMKAIYRRFNIKVEMRQKEGIAKPSGRFDYNFAHAEFFVYKNNIDETIGENTKVGPVSFEQLRTFVFRQFDNHYEAETKKVTQKLEEIRRNAITSRCDPLEVIYRHGLRNMDNEDATILLAEYLNRLHVPEITYVRADGTVEGQNDDQVPVHSTPGNVELEADMAMRGGIITIANVAGFIGSTTRGFGIWVHNKLSKKVVVDFGGVRSTHGVCCICFLEGTLVGRCATNVESHSCCMSCYSGLQSNRRTSCPMCRDPYYGLLVDPEAASLLTASERSWNLVYKYAGKLITYLGGFIEAVAYVTSLYTAFTMGPMMSVLNLMLITVNTVAGITIGRGFTNYLHYVRMALFNPSSMPVIGEIDDEDPLGFDLVDRPNETPELADFEIDRDYVEGRWRYYVERCKHLDTVCEHYSGSRLDDLGTITFLRGNFVVDDRGIDTVLKQYPCGKHCKWLDFDVCYNFLVKFVGTRRLLYTVPDLISKAPIVEVPIEVVQVVTRPWYEVIVGVVGDFFRKYWKLLAIASGIVLGGFSLWKVIPMLCGGPVAQVVSSGDAQTARQAHSIGRAMHRTFAARRGQATGQVGISDECRNSDLLQAIRSKVLRNTVVIKAVKDGKNLNMLGLGIRNNFVMLVKHYKPYIMEAEFCEIFRWMQPTLVRRFVWADLDVVESENVDLMILRVEDINMFTDITGYMMPRRDVLPLLPSEGQFLDIDAKGLPKLENMALVRVNVFGWIPENTFRTSMGDYSTTETIVYDYERKGACGCVLLIDSQNPLVAMHHAGFPSSREGYGAPLIREDIIEAIESFDIKWTPDVDERISVAQVYVDDGANVNLQYPPGFGLGVIDVVTKRATPFVNAETSIIPSLISKHLNSQPSTFPAVLSARDPRFNPEHMTPLVAGVLKHAKTWMSPNSARVQRVYEVYREMVLEVKPLVAGPTELTWKQAAMGLENFPEYPKLKTDTSSGWPWSCEKNDKSKGWAINYIYDEARTKILDVVFDEKFLEYCEKGIEQRCMGIMQPTVFQEFLKDERRKEKKILMEGGTRLIDGAPMDYSLIKRKFFLHFSAAYMKARFKLCHAIGIDTASDWTNLVNHLLSVGNNIIALDYTDFGPSICPAWIRVLGRIRYEWNVKYGIFDNDPKWWKFTSCLTEEICNAWYIAGNGIVEGLGGSPSGDIGTAEQNSNYNVMMLLDAFFCLTKLSFEEFKKYVRLVVYGDDIIMSVSDHILDLFNAHTISDFFLDNGIICTDESKEQDFPRARDILDVTFLKRGFRSHPHRIGKWLAPMPQNAIEDIAHYIRKCVNLKVATRDNVLAALWHWYHHGKGVFDNKRQEYNWALSLEGIETVKLTWTDLDIQIFEQNAHIFYE